MHQLYGRDFLKEDDFSAAELTSLIELARELKAARRSGEEIKYLEGKSIALIFEKSSTRTRCAFEVAAYQQGGFTTYLDPSSSQIGHKESVADTARVLSTMYQAIEFRGSQHALVEELAEHATVPVYNGLTDDWHPTQMLADFLTMQEYSPKPFTEIAYTYIGDARNNMGNSLLMMGAIMGSDVRICAPKALWPEARVLERAQIRAVESGARITVTENPAEAVAGSDFITTDVWVSMGEPAEVWDERISLLRPYRVDESLVEAARNPAVKVMHCLPAYHDDRTAVGRSIAEKYGLHEGVEITHDVFESDRSIVIDEAENRMHTIKAVMVATLSDHHRN
ncbi:MAG: Ornithine carbamoyltransferase [Actinomycetota bacterium]